MLSLSTGKSLKRQWKEGKLLSQLEEWNNLEEKKKNSAKEEEEKETEHLGRKKPVV